MARMSKGRRQRRSFTDESQGGALRLVLDEGNTIAQVARDLDLTPSALGGWVEQARAHRSKGKTSLTREERAELARLKKENLALRMERDLPKKAGTPASPTDSTTTGGGWSQASSRHPVVQRRAGVKVRTRPAVDVPAALAVQPCLTDQPGWSAAHREYVMVAADDYSAAGVPGECVGRKESGARA